MKRELVYYIHCQENTTEFVHQMNSQNAEIRLETDLYVVCDLILLISWIR
jgi:hypothetical protein